MAKTKYVPTKEAVDLAKGKTERNAQKLRNARRDAFIKVLANYLVRDQAKRSIQLEMGSSDAKEWAEMRSLTPLMGYPTVDEAVQVLKEFLK